MTYYDNSEAALLRRKIKRMAKNPATTGDDWLELMHTRVPDVSERPRMSDYGIDENTEAELKIEDERSVKTKTRIFQIVLVSLIAIAAAIGYSRQKSVGDAFGWAFAAFWGGIIFGAAFWMDVKPTQTPRHKALSNYKSQLQFYEYWQRRKQKDYWLRMSGRQFEESVAQLFRKHGYTARITNQGGDGGVDIWIERDGKKMIVQCKRYNKPIGPHVIRDLYGTMHQLKVDEACIASTGGFTKGVREFADGKNIELLDLNRIVELNKSIT